MPVKIPISLFSLVFLSLLILQNIVPKLFLHLFLRNMNHV